MTYDVMNDDNQVSEIEIADDDTSGADADVEGEDG
jgi:hypothetical protein